MRGICAFSENAYDQIVWLQRGRFGLVMTVSHEDWRALLHLNRFGQIPFVSSGKCVFADGGIITWQYRASEPPLRPPGANALAREPHTESLIYVNLNKFFFFNVQKHMMSRHKVYSYHLLLFKSWSSSSPHHLCISPPVASPVYPTPYPTFKC